MTVVSCYLHQWEADDWKLISRLEFVETVLYSAPGWISTTREAEWIDWGTQRYEVTKDELRRLVQNRPDFSHIKAEWDRPFREIAAAQDALITPLPDDGRYAVDWEEGI